MDKRVSEQKVKVRISILHKITLYATLLVLMAVAISTYVAVKMEYNVLTSELIRFGKHQARNIGFAANNAFWSLNWTFVEKALHESVQLSHKEIISTRIVKPSGEIYLADDRECYGDIVDSALLFAEDTILTDHFFPERQERGILLVNPTDIGQEKWHILVGLSYKPVKVVIKNLIIYNVAWGGAIVLLGILGSFALSRTISKPIISLTKAAEIISQKDLDYRVAIKSRDELGLLAGSFNDMAAKLKESHERLEERVRHRTAELEEAHTRLTDTSRQVGMAEVATDVLHNVGNILNSINVATTLIREKVSKSEVSNLKKVSDIINEHDEELATFLAEDPKGRHIPVYLAEVSKFLIDEQADIIEKLQFLAESIEHIKEIVRMQQSYAKMSGVEEPTSLGELVENAIQINSAAVGRHGIHLVRDFADPGPINIDKQKVLQILVNLISNAKYAMVGSNKKEKVLIIRFYRHGADRVRIEVADNGVGIPQANLTKIFSHGFTTKKDGHGFGLHSGALAAEEIGGSLTAHSDGQGKGSTFTLELPFKPVKVLQ